jgi:peroxiredoxin Q/BCP
MKIGERVPDFNLPDQDWNELKATDLLGEPFVIYFYPKDDTPGCTKQACAFRDHFADFEERGIRVIGVSADSPEAHRNFKEKHKLPFTLLSDPGRNSHKAFGVSTNFFGLLPGRVTYVFDHEGCLIHFFSSQVNMERHVEESLMALNEHGA